MPTTKTKREKFMDRVRAAFRSKDEAALEEVLEDAELQTMDPVAAAAGGNDEVHIHLGDSESLNTNTGSGDTPTQMDAETASRFEGLESKVNDLCERMDAAFPQGNIGAGEHDAEETEEMLDEVPEEMKDAAEEELKKGTADSAMFKDSVSETVSLAEILVPGIRIPTYDSKSKPKATYDAICQLRRTALDLAYAQPETRGILEEINRGPIRLSKMKCSDARTLFRAAAAVKRTRNNDQQRGNVVSLNHGIPAGGKIRSMKDVNEMNRKYYGGK